jgi:hypothetical protein
MFVQRTPRKIFILVFLVLVSVSVGSDAPFVSGQQRLIWPEDLVYMGAFRLPAYQGDLTWDYSGAAMAYYPDGDLDGPDDGYPGSIFATGHDWYQYVAEINIPIPVIAADRSLESLNTAEALQDFHDLHGGFYDYLEIPRTALAYLPPQGEQSTGKLYFAWAAHMGENETNPSHGWSELTLNDPRLAGPWRIGEYKNYVTGDYLFAVPQDWADRYVSGKTLATGRFRDGGQGAQGPSIITIAPWQEGNPPPANSSLAAIPLLLYGDVYADGSPTMDNYHHADEWTGAAWLTMADRSAVIFVGTKGTGDCWYGCSDGTVWEEPYPDDCPDHDRGWWSTGFEGQIIFYNPTDLAAVATGAMDAWQPQPYAILPIDSYLYGIHDGQQKSHTGAVSFDRERGLLYVFEPLADEDRSVIHVWQVRP